MKTIKPNIKNLLKGYSYINSNINETNYPLPKSIDLTGVKIIRMGKSFSSQEALDRIKAEGCRPATIWELAAFKQENEDELKGKSEWYLAFGSTDFVADGYHRVPNVYAHSDGDFDFVLCRFGYGWDVVRCLVAFSEDKTIKLLNGEETIVNNEDFVQFNSHQWHLNSEGYACRTNGKKECVYLHREINKTPSGFHTDHINRNKLDNRRSNLRTVTSAENQLNTGLRVDNTSGERGISKKGNKWQVHLRRNGNKYFLGNFDTIEEAVVTRNGFCDNNTQTLGTSKKLESLDSLTLESAIKICKENGLEVYKKY